MTAWPTHRQKAQQRAKEQLRRKKKARAQRKLEQNGKRGNARENV